MKIRKFNINRSGWVLNDLVLQDLNLIVGKNASGKSRTLDALNALARAILQFDSRSIQDASWYIEFEGENSLSLSYSLHYINSEVVEERIVYNSKEVMVRSQNDTKIWSFNKSAFEFINPPDDKLVLHVRRDTVEYPFLEELVNWAECSFGLQFGKISPKWINEKGYKIDLLSPMVSVTEMFNDLSDSAKNNILGHFRNMGYNLSHISTREIKIYDGIEFMVIEEDGVEGEVFEYAISQGMLRSLYLLVFIEHLICKGEKPQLVAIDDFGEGLDYSRVTKLGKILFEVCEQNGIQLIVTSNDSFLMDVIDIKYWSVLLREGSEVKAITKNKYPQLFDDFKFTGLSNFDFFSSDYIEKYLATHG